MRRWGDNTNIKASAEELKHEDGGMIQLVQRGHSDDLI
jgi:hypothetical protein